ncbi:MAG: hypothetical protein JST06_01115 [Bacteroidetes bacterium]|nr:hypothetical protein [Bacteroidota bacterium]MBS1629554.1 hypothetical protein [Bacteroidota bacterium]
MIILNSQLKALEAFRLATFRPRMVQHLSNHFRELTMLCGEEGLVKIIDDAASLIQPLGLKTNTEVCIFIDLCVMLGRGFDTDPLLSWTAQILGKPEADKPVLMEKLMNAAVKFRTQVLGDDLQPPTAVYERMIQADYDEVEDRIKGLSQPGFLEYLDALWPEKFAVIDESGIGPLQAESIALAKRYGITSPEGAQYVCVLMFLLGHHFDRDFQYEWLINILNDPKYDTEYYKLCSLHFTLQKYFEAMMEKADFSNE